MAKLLRYLILAVAATSLSFTIVVAGVAADDSSITTQDFYSANDINFFGNCDTSEASVDGLSGDDAVKNSNENAEAIFKFLISNNFKNLGDKPMNAKQAAAVVGNFYLESGLDPKSVNSIGASGIAQWLGGRADALKGLASSKGKSWDDLGIQLEYLKSELDGAEGRVLKDSRFINGSVEEAAYAWDDVFERSGHAGVPQRQKYAKGYYDKFKDLAPSAKSNKSSGRIVWLGDSRTVGMKSAVSEGDNEWIAKVSMGYDWFVNDAVKEAKSKISKGDTVVFAFGVNDLGNIDKYISKLNELAKADWKEANVIAMSVNPTDPNKYKGGATNQAIEDFNKKLKSGIDSKIKYVDTYSQIKDKVKDHSSDGLHYDNSLYKEIYDLIRKAIGDSDDDGDECEGSKNPNIDGYTFPFTVSSGTTKQSDLTSWYGSPSRSGGPTAKGGDLCHKTLAEQGHCHHGPFPDGAIDLTVIGSYQAGTGYQPKGEQYLAITDGYIKNLSHRHGSSSCGDVTLMGDDGWSYWYGHGSSWAISNLHVGQKVKSGDKINEMGISFCADNTSPHLHIDRGSPKGAQGGIEGHRDTDFPVFMNKLFKTLPQ